MTVVISIRLDPMNSRERKALQVLQNWNKKGYGNRYTIVEALLNLEKEQTNEVIDRIDRIEHGSGRRITFGNGEIALSQWMAENAYVTWMVVVQPWILEEHLICAVNLPLNLKGNQKHPFYPVLTAIRKKCR